MGCDYLLRAPVAVRDLYGEALFFPPSKRASATTPGRTSRPPRRNALENAGLDAVNFQLGGRQRRRARRLQPRRPARPRRRRPGPRRRRPRRSSDLFQRRLRRDARTARRHQRLHGRRCLGDRPRPHRRLRRLLRHQAPLRRRQDSPGAGRLYAWSGGQWDPAPRPDKSRTASRATRSTRIRRWSPTSRQWSGSGGGNNPRPPPPPAVFELRCPPGGGKLYCDNTDNSAMYASDNFGQRRREPPPHHHELVQLLAYGEEHSWWKQDLVLHARRRQRQLGRVPAVDLDTSSSFDEKTPARTASPSARRPRRPLPALPSNCNVHSGRQALLREQPGPRCMGPTTTRAESSITSRTTTSWFTCWGTGQLHAGGNTTWYYTQGDDNGHWGWVPAVDLETPSSFATPTRARTALPRCN